jgi:hypothetical protein
LFSPKEKTYSWRFINFDCPFVDFISFWIECSIIVILSSCVACLCSCLAVSAELVSSRRLFPEDLSLDDETLGFVILAAVVEGSSRALSGNEEEKEEISCS